ncbi:MAG: hypothetical protein K2N38_09330 [Oscillospiraceae bacterium]|nr:hypothetical protein [Oscillospiraceae bacterium]
MKKRAFVMSIILCILCAVLVVMCFVDGVEKHSLCAVIASVSSAFNACMAARRRKNGE